MVYIESISQSINHMVSSVLMNEPVCNLCFDERGRFILPEDTPVGELDIADCQRINIAISFRDLNWVKVI